MERKPIEIEGFVREITKNNYVFIGLSGTLNSMKNPKIEIDRIKFRNSIAPKSLVLVNSRLFLKIKDSKVIECNLDPNLNIIAGFYNISDVDPINCKVNFFDGFDAFLVEFDKVLDSEGKSKPANFASGQPALLYFNGDAVIEARIIHDKWSRRLKLDSFQKDRNGEEINNYYFMKDENLITYKIKREAVYYKGKMYQFDSDKISKCIGTEVYVCCSPNDITAEVNLKITENSLKIHKERNKSIPKNSNNYIDLTPIPKFGKRKQLYEGADDWFYKDYNNLNDKGVILLALIEMCFRTNDKNLLNLLQNQFREAEQENYREFTDKLFNEILSSKNSAGQIEKLYELVFTFSVYLEYVAGFIVKNPKNLALVAETFKICFYVLTNNQWTFYSPLIVNPELYCIFFKISEPIQIIYNQEMMRIDGYDLTTLNYSQPELGISHLLYARPPAQEQTQDLLMIFKTYHELQHFISIKDLSNESKILELNLSLVSLFQNLFPRLGQNNTIEIEEYYKKVLDFEFRNRRNSNCLCGDEADGTKYCSEEHYLCKKCVFISSRCRSCIQCKQVFNYESAIESLSCQNCKQSYSKEYFFGFPCRCIICTSCVYQLINSGYQTCYSNHQLEFRNESVDYLKTLGYWSS